MPAAVRAKCIPYEIEHDRVYGPTISWVAQRGPVDRVALERFKQLNRALLKELARYANFSDALLAGYVGPVGDLASHALPGALPLTLLRPRANLASPTPRQYRLELQPPDTLFYVWDGSQFALLGGGYTYFAPSRSQFNPDMPPALVHWHFVRFACTAAPLPYLHATFKLKGQSLDWTWPGYLRYARDRAPFNWSGYEPR